jgi:hypothetical protein
MAAMTRCHKAVLCFNQVKIGKTQSKRSDFLEIVIGKSFAIFLEVVHIMEFF